MPLGCGLLPPPFPVHALPPWLDDYVAALPALGMVLAVQPDVVRGRAADGTLRGRGFLARVLYAVPPSLVGRRRVEVPPVPQEVEGLYRERLGELWRIAATADPSGKEAPHGLHFSREADALMADFQSWLEPQLGEDGALAGLAGWPSKLAAAPGTSPPGRPPPSNWGAITCCRTPRRRST
jgi:hypothetical protein